VTEFGRRAALMAGSLAFAISFLVGFFADGDLVAVSLRSFAALVIFGIGGMLIGNLAEGYTVQALRREAMRRQVAREIEREMKAEMSMEEAVEEVEEVTTEIAS
jgi:hypothetical protein